MKFCWIINNVLSNLFYEVNNEKIVYIYVIGLWNVLVKMRSFVGMVLMFWYFIIYKKVIKFDFWGF